LPSSKTRKGGKYPGGKRGNGKGGKGPDASPKEKRGG